MATIGIDLTALSTPDGDGIGTLQLHTTRAPAEPGLPNRSLTYVLPPVDGLWRSHRLDPLWLRDTRRAASMQAESPA